MLVPVPEVMTSPGRGGRRLPRRARRKVAAQGRLAAAGAIPVSLVMFPLSAAALPLGGQVVSGQATLQTSGSTLNVTQSTQNATIDYQSFNVGANETVNFRQPGSSSVTLNQVLGSNASAIYGHINANGQVFLVNPNGIYFAPGAQVNVGGLVASTEAISAQDLAKGQVTFSGNSPNSVVNKGTITAAKGGYVAFIGAVVDNEGKIITPNGMTALGAGSSVDLSFSSNSLAHFQVSSAALNAAVKNGGAIIAPNGAVILTVQAKDALLQTVVNNTGIIQAQGVAQNGGDIQLLGGGSGTVENSGTLDASSAGGTGGLVQISGQHVVVHDGARIIATGAIGGGTINIGGGVHGAGALPQAVTTIIAQGAVVNASATANGNGGSITVWSNVANPASITQAYGTFLAQGGPAGGDGGYIETSGHNLSVTGAVVDTSAPEGAAGTWLLDPYNVTIASNNASGTGFSSNYNPGSNSVILNSSIDTALNAGDNVSITTGSGGSSNGNITVNAPISWSTASQLNLNAAGNIIVNAAIRATDASGTPTLIFQYGQSSAAGAGASYSINAPVNLTSNSSFQTRLGSAGATLTYNVIDSLAALQAIGGGLSGDYVLGTNLTAGGSNFTPIGSSGYQFGGIFDGLGHIISGLNISYVNNRDVGLFGYTSTNAVIRDIGLVDVSVSGYTTVGGLVGHNAGTVSNAYVTGNVSGGGSNIGGVAGINNGTVKNSYSTATIQAGQSYAGGLVGSNAGGKISNAYATGAVSGGGEIGGLAGSNSHDAVISNAYATGQVSASGSNYNGQTLANAGGLVGANTSNSTINNAYATGKVTASYSNAGGLVGYNSSGKISDAYATGNVSGTGSVGGLVGRTTNSVPVLTGYWDKATTGQTASAGSTNNDGLTTAQLAAALPAGFSSSVWANAGNQITPYLIANDSFNTVSGSVLLGSDTSTTPTPYNVITSMTQLQNINTTGLGLNYVLGNSLTDTVQTGYGFTPLGNSNRPFTGMFDGLGYTIADLYINSPQNDFVGLFGAVGSNGVIRNIGLLGGSVAGFTQVGDLVGSNEAGTVSNAYATGNVSATQFGAGGLVGGNAGTIIDAYATGSVLGMSYVGGMVGNDLGTISNAYATGSVSGGSRIGGLVGGYKGTINNVYATGKVTGTGNYVGGLAGINNGGTINSGYWDSTTTGQSTSAGSTNNNGLTTAELAAALPTGFSSSVWANAGGQTTPYLLANDGFGTVSGSVILGSDTSTTPTQYNVITSMTQLQNINSTGLGLNYMLGNSLTDTVTTGRGFSPIGSNTNSAFTGMFDGLGNTISDLYISRPGSADIGLFGAVGSTSVIRNLGLVGGSIRGELITGALAGVNFGGTISNAYATGSVSASYGYAGGLVGSNVGGKISDAYATGNVSGFNDIGGLVGFNNGGTISNAYATGSVSASFGYAGGLVGSKHGGKISDAYATGNVSGTNDIGGLAGFNNGGTISNAYATGSVSGVINVGGLAGSNNGGTISDSYANGSVHGDQSVGGLVGFNASNGKISNAYATGSVSGRAYVGGLTGVNGGTISDAYSSGSVTATGGDYAGGLVGSNDGTISDAYAAGNVTATGSAPGAGSNVGGLVGVNQSNAKISNAYATGSVSGKTQIGGLVGFDQSNSTISDVYATGKVTGSNAGGLIGVNNAGIVSNAYWDSATAGQTDGISNSNNANVTGETTSALAASLPAGFASSVWANAGNQITPYLIANDAFGTVSGAVLLGSDTSTTPKRYNVISSMAQLQNINSTGLRLNYVLGTNLTDNVTTGPGFTPIGNSNNAFTGVFDGLYYTIDNLYIDRPNSSNVGLFGDTGHALIENIGLENVNIKGGNRNLNTGGLVGTNSGTIRDAYVTGTVSGYAQVGGLVGFNQEGGKISNSYAAATVLGHYSVGGIAGVNRINASISNAYATGSVSGVNYVGGLIGSNDGAVSDVYAANSVSGTGYVGGLIGSNHNSPNDGYWDKTTTGQATSGGSASSDGLTTAQLAAALPAGFSSNVWADAGGQTTPYLIANDAFGTVSGSVLLGSDASTTPAQYNVITSMTQLQNINTTGLGLNYVLGTNLTDTVQTGAGFTPIGNSNTAFTGIFDGLSHTINNLYTNTSGSNTGLFGSIDGATIRNIGLAGENISGGKYTGGLVGTSTAGTVSNAYTTGSVTGNYIVGGLVGFNSTNAKISNAYSSASVSGTNNTGGLVGSNWHGAEIINAYATGAVSGTSATGGLVGCNCNGGIISNAYAANTVNGRTNTGSLVAFDPGGQTINGYWDSTLSGGGSNGLTTAQLAAALPSGFSSSVWANAGNQTTPYLIANESFNTVSGSVILGSDTSTTPTPYNVITSMTQLQNINTTGLGLNYVLGNSLNASNFGNFTPIGPNSNSAFSGVFDGLGNTIGDLSINRAGSNYIGLFGVVGANGIIRNIGLVGGSITGSNGVGGLVGYNNGGKISDAYATGSVSGNYDVGGLVGDNLGTISNAYATGNVSGSNSVGALVGYNIGGTISNAYATGNVSGNSAVVGGLVGENFLGTISNAYATGNVSGTNQIGGLVGYDNGGSISDAFATGSVTSSGNSDAGGLVGYNNGGKISDAFATGKVMGSQEVGGLVGVNSNGGTISNAYATSSVSGGGNIGGLVGYNDAAKISDAYAIGNVTGSGNVGGLVGSDYLGTVSNGYWDTTTTGQSKSAGSTNNDGLTTAALAAALPAGLSSSVWANGGGQTTPYLIANDAFGTVSGSVILGSDTSATPTQYNVITGMTQLQNINTTGLRLNYVLGTNLTDTVQSGAGFTPIGNNNNPFTGMFDGLNHTITGLYEDVPGNFNGLFGVIGSSGLVRNVGLVAANVKGSNYVGGLAGLNIGTISNAYATGSVSGRDNVGGLVGVSGGTVSNAYATGSVFGNSNVGGLMGRNRGTLSDAYATDKVMGDLFVGGLVGLNDGGSISNAYATGSVSGSYYVGGLVGQNSNNGTIDGAYATGNVTGSSDVGGLVGLNATGASETDGYWNTNSTGQKTSAGGTGLTAAQMLQQSSFTGFDFSTPVWVIYNGHTTPLLAAFLTPLTITASNQSATYTGAPSTLSLLDETQTVTGTAPAGTLFGNSGNIFGLSQPYDTAIEPGAYTPDLYSDQQGYLISYKNAQLTINPAINTSPNIGVRALSIDFGDIVPPNNFLAALGLLTLVPVSVIDGGVNAPFANTYNGSVAPPAAAGTTQ